MAYGKEPLVVLCPIIAGTKIKTPEYHTPPPPAVAEPPATEAMEVDSEAAKKEAEAAATAEAAAAKKAEEALASVVAAQLPEVEVYLSTLALTTLLRHKANADAVAVAPRLLERAVSFNRRCGGRGRARKICVVWSAFFLLVGGVCAVIVGASPG